MSGIDRRTSCERDGAGDGEQQLFFQVPMYAVIGGGGMLLAGGVWAGYARQKIQQKLVEAPLIRPGGSGSSVVKNRACQLGFNPYNLAFKALGYGTLLSVSTFAVGCVGLGCAMGVKDLKGFGDVMKVWMPAKLEQLGYRPPQYIVEEKKLLAGMSQAEEKEYWLSFFKEEDETEQSTRR